MTTDEGWGCPVHGWKPAPCCDRASALELTYTGPGADHMNVEGLRALWQDCQIPRKPTKAFDWYRWVQIALVGYLVLVTLVLGWLYFR